MKKASMSFKNSLLVACLIFTASGCVNSPEQITENDSNDGSANITKNLSLKNTGQDLSQLSSAINEELNNIIKSLDMMPNDYISISELKVDFRKLERLIRNEPRLRRDSYESINQDLVLLTEAISQRDFEIAKSSSNSLKQQLGELEKLFNQVNRKSIEEQNDNSAERKVSINYDYSKQEDNKQIATYLPILASMGSAFIGGFAAILSVLLFDYIGRKFKGKKRSTQKLQPKDSNNLDNSISPWMPDISLIDQELKKIDTDSGERFFKMDQRIQILEQRLRDSGQIINNQSPSSKITPASPSKLIPENESLPLGPSKIALMSDLNKGGQQLLRDAAFSQLNITSESKNAIAIGDAIRTELEEVSGGGSYLSVRLQGQVWLFPTERSLKSFNASQKSKGIFDCEKQTTISSPQLLEPALLEGSGDKWIIKQIGKIAIP